MYTCVVVLLLFYRQTFSPQTSMHKQNLSGFNIGEAKEPIVLFLEYYNGLNQEHYCKDKKTSQCE